MLTKKLLQGLADARCCDAEVLLAHQQYSGAYYLAGYAIECALKARAASRFFADVIPQKDLVNKLYTHRLDELVGLAGLKSELDQALKDPDFAARWGFVSNWTEASRYETWDSVSATAMYNSIADPAKGILQWIKKYW
jgi:hypothetical protein